MRIAVASMMHETNTFTRLTTSLADFRLHCGDAIYGAEHGTVVHGILDTLRSAGVEVIPTYFARALPSGLIRRDAFEHITTQILDGIRRAMPLDGVCLALHGSMCAEGCDDAEGYLLERIRGIVGDVPITCALDMHATVSCAMVDYADGFAAYRTAPHEDEPETGAAAASLLLIALRDGGKLHTARAYLPLFIPGEMMETSVSPAKELFASLSDYESDGVLRASYAIGFPWADSPYNGVTALVTGTNALATQVAADALIRAFDAIMPELDFSTPAYPFDECIRIARHTRQYPFIISDMGDNPTAGSSQNLSIALQQLIELGVQNAIFAAITDVDAYNVAAANVGRDVTLDMGTLVPYTGEIVPLTAAVHVKCATHVKGANYAVVTTHGVDVVFCDRRVEVYDPDILAQLGVPVTNYEIAVLKSGYISNAYKALCAHNVLALTPGDTCGQLTQLPYTKAKNPIFPTRII